MASVDEERPDETASDEHTKSRFRQIATHAFQMYYTKFALEQGPVSGAFRGSYASDNQGAPNSSKTSSDASMNSGPTQVSHRARQGMSAKRAGKQRAASNPENSNSQALRPLQLPLFGSAGSSHSFQNIPIGSETFAPESFDNFSYVQHVSAAPIPQDFQVDPTVPSLGGTFHARPQMTPQIGAYGSYVPIQAPLHPRSSISGTHTYPSTHGKENPSFGIHLQHNNTPPQFYVPQYQEGHRHSFYATNQTISPDGGNFPVSPTSHPVNASSPNGSGFANFPQVGMSGMPYWTDNSSTGN